MEKIEKILNSVYEKKTANEIEKDKFAQFVKSVVNGDTLIDFFCTSAILYSNKEGILLYILTNTKLVNIVIENDKFGATSTYLKQIIRIDKFVDEKKEDNNATVIVEFPQGRIGLNYPATAKEVDDFFQKVDQEVAKCGGKK